MAVIMSACTRGQQLLGSVRHTQLGPVAVPDQAQSGFLRLSKGCKRRKGSGGQGEWRSWILLHPSRGCCSEQAPQCHQLRKQGSMGHYHPSRRWATLGRGQRGGSGCRHGRACMHMRHAMARCTRVCVKMARCAVLCGSDEAGRSWSRTGRVWRTVRCVAVAPVGRLTRGGHRHGHAVVAQCPAHRGLHARGERGTATP